MDENLNTFVEEEFIEVSTEETLATEPTIEEVNNNPEVDEVIEDVEVEVVEEIEVEVDEAIGWSGSDGSTHSGLYDRNTPDQHIITSITGLREELNEIERLKTVYSDKYNVANYYKWDSGSYDEVGYFVSIVPRRSTIKVCDGSDIFGVSVKDAGFIGGQDANIPRKDNYGLIVTSGLVSVRCELNVEVGNYVISNNRGIATKSVSNCGYKVLSIEYKNHVPYAVIMLGVQADVTNTLGEEVLDLDERLDVAENNIVSAINVANQAYQKSVEASQSSSVSEESVKQALQDILDMGTSVENIKDALSQTNSVVVQAQTLANSAATAAQGLRDEAVAKANEAWSDTENIKDSLQPILKWRKDGVTGVEYLVTRMTDGISTTYEIKEIEDDLKIAQSAIIKNGKELQSLMTNIDKYSVGEYSQAHGLTLEQAQNILEIGMIYVPTSHITISGTEYHKEEYVYKIGDETKTYTRWFTPGYLYKWDMIPNNEVGVGWKTIGAYEIIAIDENYDGVANPPKDSSGNTVGPWVFFSIQDPSVSDQWDNGYWFAQADENGKTNPDTYEPNTLYKWEESASGNYWSAVATLVGNVSNRLTSSVTQTTNEIVAEITNAYGGVADFGTKLSDTEATVGTLASWKNGEGKVGEAIIRQEAKDDGTSSIVISTLQRNADDEVEASASLVLSSMQKEDGSESFLAIDADNIHMDGKVTFTNWKKQVESDVDDAQFTASSAYSVASGVSNELGNLYYDPSRTTIDGGNIQTGTLSANQITTGVLQGHNYKHTAGNVFSDSGVGMDLDNGYLRGKHFAIDSNGDAHLGGWEITKYGITDAYEAVGMLSGTLYQGLSLVSKETSPIRFFADRSQNLQVDKMKSFEVTHKITEETFDIFYVVPIDNLNQITNVSIVSHDFLEAHGECQISVMEREGDVIHFTVEINAFEGIEYCIGSTLTFEFSVEYTALPEFCVLEDGSLYAMNAKIKGKVYATDGEFTGKVYATDGEFTGTVYATDGEFNGSIYARDGQIGNFVISDGIYSEQTSYDGSTSVSTYNMRSRAGGTGVYIGTDGIGLGSGKFYVTNSGHLYASDVDITGKITAQDGGDIGGWTVSTNILKSPTMPVKIGGTTYQQSVELTPAGITVTTDKPINNRDMRSFTWASILNAINQFATNGDSW